MRDKKKDTTKGSENLKAVLSVMHSLVKSISNRQKQHKRPKTRRTALWAGADGGKEELRSPISNSWSYLPAILVSRISARSNVGGGIRKRRAIGPE